MATKRGQQVIAIEEHYWDRELSERYGAADGGALREKLEDLGDQRMRRNELA